MAYMKDAFASRLDALDPHRDMPRVLGWWDFTQLSAMADGAAVARVYDTSGLGHDLQQAATANKPTKQTASDGKAVARFSGATSGSFSLLSAPQFGAGFPSGGPIPAPVTIVAVAKVSSANTGFPLLAGGVGAAGNCRLLIDAGTTKNAFSYGGTTQTSLVGPSVCDDQWHVIIGTVDLLSGVVYVDGFLAAMLTTSLGTDGLKTFNVGATGTAGNGISADIREVMVFQGRLRFGEVAALTKFLAARAPVVVPLGDPDTGVGWETSTDANGVALRIFTPRTPSAVRTLVVWSHPAGQTEAISPGYWAYGLAHAAQANGWYMVASAMHGDSWGNAQAITDHNAAIAAMVARGAYDKVILVGASMGGVTTALQVAAGTITNLKGAYFIDAVLSLSDQYANASYTAAIKTAYGIAADGSDYAAKTAGHDPMLVATASYPTSLAYRFVASTADTTVNKANNTDAFRTKIAGRGTESALVIHGGNHLAGAAADASDLVQFIKRAIA